MQLLIATLTHLVLPLRFKLARHGVLHRSGSAEKRIALPGVRPQSPALTEFSCDSVDPGSGVDDP